MPHSRDVYDAIDADDVHRIKRLLAMRPSFVNSTGETPPPLHWAIYRDRRGAVEALLNHGADLDLRDRDRDATPLDYAVVYARKELIALLISRGANPESGMRVAVKGASGGFEEYAELPDRRDYEGVVELLRELGSP
ncbi:MAG: ankyrin repeat domain-containing protein [Paracoccaceae bacterium]|nr:ankyrin repeat domain-containing protein [Paracoccaceae bacterium]